MPFKKTFAAAGVVIFALGTGAATAGDPQQGAETGGTLVEPGVYSMPGFEVYQGIASLSPEHVEWCRDNQPDYDEQTDTYQSQEGRVPCVAPSD